jgi:hypothetical protein
MISLLSTVQIGKMSAWRSSSAGADFSSDLRQVQTPLQVCEARIGVQESQALIGWGTKIFPPIGDLVTGISFEERFVAFEPADRRGYSMRTKR